MSSDSTPVDLAQAGLAFARGLADDLSALIGQELRLKGPTVEYCEAGQVVSDDDPVAHALLRTRSESEGHVHLVMPRPEAATLASLLMGQSKERIEERRTRRLDEETLDALGEIVNFACAALSRILHERHGLPALSVASTREVDSPHSDPGWLDPGSFRVARFKLVLPEYDDGALVLLFPEALAEPWFGPRSEGASVGGSAEGAARAASSGGGEPASVVFVDLCDEDRDAAEDLEEALGWPVWTLEPGELRADELDELGEAGAIVIDWDLGVRPGLAYLEVFRNDERTRHIPVIMASARPTAAMVRAALHAGAESFVTKPWDAAELRSRLQRLLEQRLDLVG